MTKQADQLLHNLAGSDLQEQAFSGAPWEPGHLMENRAGTVPPAHTSATSTWPPADRNLRFSVHKLQLSSPLPKLFLFSDYILD